MEPKIHFIHYRIYNPSNANYLACSGVTLAYREMEPSTIEYAASYCSPNDIYNKTIGRNIATARLDRNSLIAETDFEIFEEICKNPDLRLQESYSELLDELADVLGIDIPAAHMEYKGFRGRKYGFEPHIVAP